MNKEEFLEELRNCLSGKMSPDEVESNVDYYRAYIEGEIMKGRPEEDVMAELGHARLIAKTLTVNIDSDKTRSYYENSGSSDETSRQSGSGEYSDEAYDTEGSRKGSGVKRAAGIVITVVVIILLLFLFGSILRGTFRLLIRFLPFIVMVIIVMSVFRGMSGRR